LPRSRKSCVGRGFARASSQSSRASIRRIAVVVDDPTSISAATRDPDDDYLVALARQHTVDYIVTGDKDLLEWDDQAPPAITPAAFEDLLSAR
jgi:predicted nucleic acid-binding protein